MIGIRRTRRPLAKTVSTGFIGVACVVALSAGCGGSSDFSGSGGEDGSTADAGKDSGHKDSGKDTGARDAEGRDAGGHHEAGADSGEDASGSCASGDGAESACTLGTTAGLCVNSTCTACSDPSDDANCTAAYGVGSTQYVCDTSGSCIVGNCHADGDCATPGQICGVVTPNTCGSCTTDAECQTDPMYGPTTICNEAAGTCVAAACTPKTPSAACVNPADVCCPASTAGACIPGNCCTDSDCATNSAGTICGGNGPNQCGKCTLDSQCASGKVCDTASGATQGQCVSNACTGPGATGGAPGTCTPNSNDMCCGPAMSTCIPNPAVGSTSVACCPGTAGDTFCKGESGLNNTSATCSGGDVCTTCQAVSLTAPVYVVDPVDGSNSGTGSGDSSDGGAEESCALKTVTRALQLIAIVGTTVPTKIVIVGGAGVTVGAGEVFPLSIPKNVTVTTKTGPVKVHVPNAKAGFVLNAANSTLTSATGALLTITTTVDGTSTPPTGGTNGIQVGGSATSASTAISNVTVTGMLNDGIHVAAGSVMIAEGVVSSKNGIATTARAGLHVTGTGAATINVPMGDPPTMFTENTAEGILVDTGGSITLTGVVTSGSDGTGTVVANGNAEAGVWIQQTPGTTAPQNVITGLVANANTAGNGMHIVAGSNVKVRGSVFLSNQISGVLISTNTATPANNDISNIDLGGMKTGNGGNTFQAPLAAGGHNGSAGICLSTAAAGAQLQAVGNVFSTATCATTAATLTLNKKGCGNNATQCPSGVCDLGLGVTGTKPNTFDVLMCTQ